MTMNCMEIQPQTDEARSTVLIAGDGVVSRQLAAMLRDDGLLAVESRETSQFVERFIALWTSAVCSLDLVVLVFHDHPQFGIYMLEYLRRIDWALPVLMLLRADDHESNAEARRLGVTTILDETTQASSMRELTTLGLSVAV